MIINRSISLFANAELLIGESNKVVANFTASIGANKSFYNINVNFIDKDLIESTEENKAAYKEQYDLFVNTVNEYLV